MPGDYVHIQNQHKHRSARVDIDGSAVSAVAILAPKTSSHQLFVQRIVLSFATHADKSISFIDDDASDVTIAAYTDEASPNTTGTTAPHQLVWDWGPNGFPLTVGASLSYTANASGSGFTGTLFVEAVEKLGATVAVANNN